MCGCRETHRKLKEEEEQEDAPSEGIPFVWIVCVFVCLRVCLLVRATYISYILRMLFRSCDHLTRLSYLIVYLVREKNSFCISVTPILHESFKSISSCSSANFLGQLRGEKKHLNV